MIERGPKPELNRGFSPERLNQLAENLGLSEEEKGIISEALQMAEAKPVMDQSSLVRIEVNRDVVEVKKGLYLRISDLCRGKKSLIAGIALLSGIGGLPIYSAITLNVGLGTVSLALLVASPIIGVGVSMISFKELGDLEKRN